MQGVILSAGTTQGLILGDDGVRYTFTPSGSPNQSARLDAGMRVDFEPSGSQAMGTRIVPSAAPAPPAAPPPPPPQVGPQEPPPQPPSSSSFATGRHGAPGSGLLPPRRRHSST